MAKTKSTNDAIVEESPRILAEHQDYMGDGHRVRDIENIKFGDVIQFTYNISIRTVFVLNPEYNLQLHGLSLNKLSHHLLLTEVVDKIRTTDTPYDFYTRVLTEPAIIKSDSYRTYDVRKMSNIAIRPYKLNNPIIINDKRPLSY